jgi:hypothetical protein
LADAAGTTREALSQTERDAMALEMARAAQARQAERDAVSDARWNAEFALRQAGQGGTEARPFMATLDADGTPTVTLVRPDGTTVPIGQAYQKPTAAPRATQGPAPDRMARTGDALRKQFLGEAPVSTASALADAVAGIKAAAEGRSPMDDLSLVYQVVKLYDPGSVVREGEIKLQQSAASLPTQLQLLLQGWSTGKKLTPQMRRDIVGLADAKVQAQSRLVRPVQADYGARARAAGADSAFVAPDPFRGLAAPPPSPSPSLSVTPNDLEAAYRRRRGGA